jgi:hypothetical protein
MSNQKMIIAALGVVAVLLAVIVGVLILKPTTPGVNTGAGAAGAASTATGAGSSSMPAPANLPFDPKTATKVPAGTEPKAYVDKYFTALEKGDYKTAFAMLPLNNKSGQTAESYGSTMKSYGMTKHSMGAVQSKGDTTTVAATATTVGGPFPYIWTFVKYNGGWVVVSRAIGGMGQ